MKTEILISTDDECNAVLALLEKRDFRWAGGQRPTDKGDLLRRPFKLYVSDKKVLTFLGELAVTPDNVSSITAAEWLQSQGEKPMKTLHEMATEAMNLQAGDTVKVLFSMPGGTHGWDNAWDDEMDRCVGKTYKVIHPESTQVFSGVLLDTRNETSCRMAFSPICLELVSRKPVTPDYPRLFLGSHKVLISPAGIRVGCQTFSFKDFDRLAHLVEDDFASREDLYYVTRVTVHGTEVPITHLKHFLDGIYPAVKYYRDR